MSLWEDLHPRGAGRVMIATREAVRGSACQARPRLTRLGSCLSTPAGRPRSINRAMILIREERARSMVGTQRDPPGVVHAEEPLQADGPLQGVDEVLAVVSDRDDSQPVSISTSADPLAPVTE